MTGYIRLDLGEIRPGRFQWLAIGRYKDGTYWLQEVISHQSKFRDFGERVKFDHFFELLDYLGENYGYRAVSKLRYLLYLEGYRHDWELELPILERWIGEHLAMKRTPARGRQASLMEVLS